MDLAFKERQKMENFFKENKDAFEEQLLNEAAMVKDKIHEIREIGNINLIENAHKLVIYIVNLKEDELVAFAKQEGIAWATHSLTLTFKLEWVQAIRRTVWKFLYDYDRLKSNPINREEFFLLEKKINEQIDQFLNTFFLSYSKYKDEQLMAQRELVRDLSVPIIPITEEVAILPLIGEIDQTRAAIIEEKVLMSIGITRIETLIMDLSGVAQMDTHAIHHLFKVIDGIDMMGSKVIITGLRPQIVQNMVRLGFTFDKAQTKGTLQKALREFSLNPKKPTAFI